MPRISETPHYRRKCRTNPLHPLTSAVRPLISDRHHFVVGFSRVLLALSLLYLRRGERELVVQSRGQQVGLLLGLPRARLWAWLERVWLERAWLERAWWLGDGGCYISLLLD